MSIATRLRVVVFATLFAGISVAGTSTATDLATQSTAVAAAGELRRLVPGMSWEYSVTGTVQPPGAPAAMPIKGRITIKIEELELQGSKSLALKFMQEIQPEIPTEIPTEGVSAPAMPTGSPPPNSIFGGATPPVGIFYFRQDQRSGDVYFIGDNHGANGATRAAQGEGGLFIPGRWSAETHYNNRIDWGGKAFTDNYLSVTGTETIATGVGARAAWRAPNGSRSSDGTQIKGTDWWAPELGQPAQFEAITQTPDGMEIRIRAVLDKTNVPL